MYSLCYCTTALQWRHNGRDGVSNHQPHDCLLNRLFGRRSKKTSKLRVTGLCAGKTPGTGEVPAQLASNAKNVSILMTSSWYVVLCYIGPCYNKIRLYNEEMGLWNRFTHHNLNFIRHRTSKRKYRRLKSYRHKLPRFSTTSSVANDDFSTMACPTGDPLHSRAACTQPCNVNTHSRAHCSPGARLCEQ